MTNDSDPTRDRPRLHLQACFGYNEGGKIDGVTDSQAVIPNGLSFLVWRCFLAFSSRCRLLGVRSVRRVAKLVTLKCLSETALTLLETRRKE